MIIGLIAMILGFSPAFAEAMPTPSPSPTSPQVSPSPAMNAAANSPPQATASAAAPPTSPANSQVPPQAQVQPQTQAAQEATTVSPDSGAKAALKLEDSGDIPADLMKLRDPFKRPATAIAEDKTPKTELEQYPVDKYRMIGVIKGLSEPRAMIVAPNGKTYFVTENMKIGLRKGFIRKITRTAIKVRETTVNELGQKEPVDLEIKLPDQGTNLSQVREIKTSASVQAVSSTGQALPEAAPGMPVGNLGTGK